MTTSSATSPIARSVPFTLACHFPIPVVSPFRKRSPHIHIDRPTLPNDRVARGPRRRTTASYLSLAPRRPRVRHFVDQVEDHIMRPRMQRAVIAAVNALIARILARPLVELRMRPQQGSDRLRPRLAPEKIHLPMNRTPASRAAGAITCRPRTGGAGEPPLVPPSHTRPPRTRVSCR